MSSQNDILYLKYPKDGTLPFGLQGLYHVHIICIKGSGSFRSNGSTHVFTKNNLVVLQGDGDSGEFEYSEDFSCVILAIPRGFMRRAGNGMVWETNGFIHAKTHPVIRLSAKAEALLLNDFKAIAARTAMGGTYGQKSLYLSLQILMFDMWNIYEDDIEVAVNNDNAHLFIRFQELVRETCERERTVVWYARKLCITPKQLSRICKEAGGSSASEWIEYYTKIRIIELLNGSSLRLDEISEQMNFSSRSYFNRCAKKMLGMTPLEFRNKTLTRLEQGRSEDLP